MYVGEKCMSAEIQLVRFVSKYFLCHVGGRGLTNVRSLTTIRPNFVKCIKVNQGSDVFSHILIVEQTKIYLTYESALRTVRHCFKENHTVCPSHIISSCFVLLGMYHYFVVIHGIHLPILHRITSLAHGQGPMLIRCEKQKGEKSALFSGCSVQ